MKTSPKKKKLKPLGWYKDKAWDLFSEYIRRRYSDEEGYGRCYTCQEPMHWKRLQASHAISGRNNAVLFDEAIVRPCCMRCNVFKHGNIEVFSTKLILENGLDWWLDKLAGSNRIVKVTRSDYEEIIEELKDKLSKLEIL